MCIMLSSLTLDTSRGPATQMSRKKDITQSLQQVGNKCDMKFGWIIWLPYIKNTKSSLLYIHKIYIYIHKIYIYSQNKFNFIKGLPFLKKKKA